MKALRDFKAGIKMCGKKIAVELNHLIVGALHVHDTKGFMVIVFLKTLGQKILTSLFGNVLQFHD